MAADFKEKMQEQFNLSAEELDTIDLILGMASRLEDAMFATFQAADMRGKDGGSKLRAASKDAWQALAQSMIVFAATSE